MYLQIARFQSCVQVFAEHRRRGFSELLLIAFSGFRISLKVRKPRGHTDDAAGAGPH